CCRATIPRLRLALALSGGLLSTAAAIALDAVLPVCLDGVVVVVIHAAVCYAAFSLLVAAIVSYERGIAARHRALLDTLSAFAAAAPSAQSGLDQGSPTTS